MERGREGGREGGREREKEAQLTKDHCVVSKTYVEIIAFLLLLGMFDITNQSSRPATERNDSRCNSVFKQTAL